MTLTSRNHVSLQNQGGGKGLGGFGGQAAAAPEADAEEEPGVLSPAAVNRVEQGPGSKAESSGKENTPRRAKKGREYRKSDLEVRFSLVVLDLLPDLCLLLQHIIEEWIDVLDLKSIFYPLL